MVPQTLQVERRGQRTSQENLEPPHRPQSLRPAIDRTLALIDPPSELPTAEHEEENRRDLPPQSRNHDIDPRLRRSIVISCRGDPTTGALQAKRYEVADDEGNGIEARAEAGEILAVDDDDARETEVNRCAKEGWANGEADEVAVSRITSQNSSRQPDAEVLRVGIMNIH